MIRCSPAVAGVHRNRCGGAEPQLGCRPGSAQDTSIAPTGGVRPEAHLQRLPDGPEGIGPACEPKQLMEALAERGCNQVLWECGPELAAAAIQQGCVQEIAAVVAPKLMGGLAARTPLADLGFTGMDQVPCSVWHQSSSLGDDWLLRLSIDS